MKGKALFWTGMTVVIAIGTYLFVHRTVHITHPPVILGHGGSGTRSSYPLNSGPSVVQAFQYPIDGVELDVRMSKDGVLFALHDQDLSHHTDCRGLVEHSLSDHLQQCHLETWLHSALVMPLDRLLSEHVPAGSAVSLDVKPDPAPGREDELIDRLAELIAFNHQLSFLIETSDLALLEKLIDSGINAKCLLNSDDWEWAVSKAIELDADGIVIHYRHISAEQVQQTRSRGLTVSVWGTGSVFSNRKALLLQPDIIQTDHIGSMMRLLDRD